MNLLCVKKELYVLGTRAENFQDVNLDIIKREKSLLILNGFLRLRKIYEKMEMMFFRWDGIIFESWFEVSPHWYDEFSDMVEIELFFSLNPFLTFFIIKGGHMNLGQTPLLDNLILSESYGKSTEEIDNEFVIKVLKKVWSTEAIKRELRLNWARERITVLNMIHGVNGGDKVDDDLLNIMRNLQLI